MAGVARTSYSPPPMMRLPGSLLLASLGVILAACAGTAPRPTCDATEKGGCFRRGTNYAQGTGGVDKDEVRAAALFKDGCESDEPRGCTALGVMMAAGLGGLVKDDAKAAALYRKACSAGDDGGCQRLRALPR